MQRRGTIILAAAIAVAPGTLLAQGADDVRRETFRLRDRNGDRRLTVEEYGGHPGNFAALDDNNDRYLSEDEFVYRRGRRAQRLPQAEEQITTAEAENVIFRSLDRNRDGFVTRGEWTGSREAFDVLDRNRDERISRQEHETGTRAQADFSTLAARYLQRDTDRDGRLTSNEWRADEGLDFARADANNDRSVSLYEYVYRAPAGRGDQRAADFDRLDVNRDSRIEAREWNRDKADFARLDADNDGIISRAEYLTPLRANTPAGRFQELDRNNDGAITRSEWRFEAVYFERLDRNDDGVIRQDEFVAGVTNDPLELAFEQADRNNDGVVSRTEWRHERVAFHQADRDGNGVVTLREYRMLPTPTNDREAQFDLLDRDNNNVLVRREWAANSTVSFEQADRNRDGVVTLWEFTNVAATQPVEESFDDQDHNNDGVISRTEWHGTAWEFDRLDVNDDRVVTLREFYANRPAPTTMSREERFRALDVNRDGYLARNEWTGDSESFAILDTVRDGRVSAYEFNNTRRLSERFGWLDQDDNGRLDRDEWPGSATSFTQVDTNRDGAVSRDEFLL